MRKRACTSALGLFVLGVCMLAVRGGDRLDRHGLDHAVDPGAAQQGAAKALGAAGGSFANASDVLGAVSTGFLRISGSGEPRYRYRAPGRAVQFSPSGVYLSYRRRSHDGGVRTDRVRLRFVGARPRPRLEGVDPAGGRIHLIRGEEARRWRTDRRRHRRLRYRELYPGIDLTYAAGTGGEGRLKSTYRVAPGADPSRIRIRYEGVESVSVGPEGALWIRTDRGLVRESAPEIFQPPARRRPAGSTGARRPLERRSGRSVEGRYRKVGPRTVGFELGVYDPERPVYVDPEIRYSSYFGGSSADELTDVAIDDSGMVYVTGHTTSGDFPTEDPYQATYHSGDDDCFVAKLDPDESGDASLLWATYLGGGARDRCRYLAVDGDGQVHVAGWTASSDYPVAGAVQGTHQGGDFEGSDGTLTKLTASGGGLVYSTFLGSSDTDDAEGGLAVDSAGSAYVAHGGALSFQVQNVISRDGHAASEGVEILKFTPSGQVDYATRVAYAPEVTGPGTYPARTFLAVDPGGRAYFGGAADTTGDVPSTARTEGFPLVDAYQSAANDTLPTGHLFRLNGAGTDLEYATFFGGLQGDDRENSDFVQTVAADADGHLYVSGIAKASEVPLKNSEHQVEKGFSDIYVAKLEPDGSGLVYGTLFGAPEDLSESFAGESVWALTADDRGRAVLAGGSDDDSFPLKEAIQEDRAGGTDAVVVRLTDAGKIDFSTYLGQSNFDRGHGVATFGSRMLVGGTSGSGFQVAPAKAAAAGFPTKNAYQASNPGSNSGFLTFFRRGLVVNSTGNAADTDTTDGACDTGNQANRGGSTEPECTLRAAIETANYDPGRETIEFDVPASTDGGCSGDVCTIVVPDPLPEVEDPVVIDGFTQPGSSANTRAMADGLDLAPKIVLTGVGGSFDGLVLTGGRTVVRGLVIQDFGWDGILVAEAGRDTLTGNIIGLDAGGSKVRENGKAGVRIAGADSNVVGGTEPADRNLISGNSTLLVQEGGVRIQNAGGDDATANRVVGNFVGTDRAGQLAAGNAFYGVGLFGVSGNRVEQNVIAGNADRGGGAAGGTVCFGSGVYVTDGASENLVAENWVGVTADPVESGRLQIPNGDGICILDAGVGNEIEENHVAGNQANGLYVEGNWQNDDERDDSDSTYVWGNEFGFDTSLGPDVGNDGYGILIATSDGTTIHENVVAANAVGGIKLGGGFLDEGGELVRLTSGTDIWSNLIGVDSSDAAAGNEGPGIHVESAAETTVGGDPPGILAANTILNNSDGIRIEGDETHDLDVVIEGNTIGENGQGNRRSGVWVDDARAVRIDNNQIAHNQGDGVTLVEESDRVRITENSIFENDGLGRQPFGGAGGLGIDLADDAVTANDAGDGDTGINQLQNYPDVTDARVNGAGKLEVSYRVPTDAAEATYPLRVEIFGSDTQGEEGEDFFFADSYAAAEAGTEKTVVSVADASALGISPGGFIVATAISDSGRTSEFSEMALVGPYETDTLALYDFGDAREEAGEIPPVPPAGYPVTTNADGAYHLLSNTVRLGGAIDGETDGQPSEYGRGDETKRVQDEDGIVFEETEYESYRAGTEIEWRPVMAVGSTRTLTVLASVSGYLSAWIDLDGDGDWQDADEQIFADLAVGSGPDRPEHQYVIPGDARVGLTFARFRFSTEKGLGPTGEAPDGEVEDYLIRLVGSDSTSGVDYGDAPSTPSDTLYRTLARHGGASHVIGSYYLGQTVDADPDGQPGEAADGDDTVDGTDDEDGVTVVGTLHPGAQGRVEVVAATPADSSGHLFGWIDFDRDNDWSEESEQVLAGVELSAGTDTLSFSVPSGAVTGATYARFRFTDRDSLAAAGDSTRPWGEVEDYRVEVTRATAGAGEDAQEQAQELPTRYRLGQNYPNPFNPSTVVPFELPRAGHVTIRIYDMIGRLVRELTSRRYPAGRHRVRFEADELSSGVYFYRMRAGSYRDVRSMLLVK